MQVELQNKTQATKRKFVDCESLRDPPKEKMVAAIVFFLFSVFHQTEEETRSSGTRVSFEFGTLKIPSWASISASSQHDIIEFKCYGRYR